jgi:FAD/FMN-containing dehydrogenase
MPIQREKLTAIVGDANVSDDQELIESFARDLSFVHPLKPRLVVRVQSGKAVQKLVEWANQTLTPLVPVSSGAPRHRGDSIPSVPGAVMVDLSGMSKIVHVDPRNRMALIEPGVTYAQLQPKLAKFGLKLSPPLLPRPGKSVLASLLEREPRLTPRFQWSLLEPLRAIEVTWGDGQLMTTGDAGSTDQLEEEWKRGFAQIVGSGPAQTDFYKVVSAAQGSMGIVSWASVKCEVLPQAHQMLLAGSQNLEPLIDLCYSVLRIRFGDEIFILNRLALASILEREAAQITALAANLPRWILAIGLAGRDRLPQERIAYQQKDIAQLAQSRGLELVAAIGSASGTRLLQETERPSADRDWKTAAKGASQEVFFLTTLDRTPAFIQAMDTLTAAGGFPSSEVGVYIQPVHQGAAAHLEFTFPYDAGNAAETTAMQGLFISASQAMLREGAFFSRPYGPWAQMAFNRDYRTTEVLRKIKAIFDPRNVMNPGKLCF